MQTLPKADLGQRITDLCHESLTEYQRAAFKALLVKDNAAAKEWVNTLDQMANDLHVAMHTMSVDLGLHHE